MTWLDGTNADKLLVQAARRARTVKNLTPNATMTLSELVEEVEREDDVSSRREDLDRKEKPTPPRSTRR